MIGLSQGHTVALPLLATQILWINLLTDGAPALAMGVDPQTEEVMDRPPRSMSDRVIDGRMWNNIIVIGAAVAAATLVTIHLYAPGGPLPSSLDTARTAGFTVLVITQLFNTLNARSETQTAFRGFFANGWLWAAIALSALLQVAVVQLPFLNTAFTTTPLSGASGWCASPGQHGPLGQRDPQTHLAVRRSDAGHELRDRFDVRRAGQAPAGPGSRTTRRLAPLFESTSSSSMASSGTRAGWT